jgi:dihydrolipoamide dehydrogenase
MSVAEVRVPDLGDSKDVSVVEVLVAKDAEIQVDEPLITLETDKASMDVPSPVAGIIQSIELKKGDAVVAGTLIAMVAVSAGVSAASSPAPAVAVAAAPQSPPPAPVAPSARAPVPAPAPAPSAATTRPPAKAAGPSGNGLAAAPPGALELVVLGAGPGGYTAAFRAADLGLKVTLIERWATLGGVCLNVGCIPSKALLHAAKVIEDAHDMGANGIAFGAPQIDFDKLRAWKNRLVAKLTGGLAGLARQRKVDVVRGTARFTGPYSLEVAGAARGSARDRVHRCAGTAAWHRALAGDRRRHHRLGNGVRLRCAGRQSERGGIERRPDARDRPRPGAAAAEADREAL